MSFQCLGISHASRPKVHINTGCLCSAGSSLPGRSPTSKLICSPPTPCPHWPPLRFPLLWPTQVRTPVLCQKGRRHVRPHTCRASETGHRLSAIPGFVEERRGPPRLRGHPLRACYGRTPRRIQPPPCPKKNSRRGLLLPSMKSSTLGIRKDDRFRGRSPTARTFACLRIAELVSKTVARRAPGSGGLTLSRAGFAPAGRRTKFHGGIASSNSL